MNEEINTVSEEQVLHNKLSFEINQELIHLMKRIVELQQENARLKDKIEKATEYIEWQRNNPQYDNIWRNYECNELLKILEEN